MLDKGMIALWGKKEDRNSRLYWMPLLVHLTDTMYVARWLWMNWLSDSQRTLCSNAMVPCDEDTALNMAAFLGAVHDIGKATPAFQIQKGYNASPELDNMLLEKLERQGFSGISELSLTSSRMTRHALAGEYLLTEKYHVRNDISSIVGGHHGAPIDDINDLYGQSSYEENYYQSDQTGADIRIKWETTQNKIFIWALNKSGFEKIEDLPELSLQAQIIYEGLLIMADWITSNVDYFPLYSIEEEPAEYNPDRWIDGIRAWGENKSMRVQTSPKEETLFERRFHFSPREFQKAVYEAVEKIYQPGMIILEAPMGLGKTEAALAAAEVVAAKTGSSGLFFGLPTQATSNSMFSRVRSWLESVASDYNVRQSLRLCHGKAALNDDMNDLREQSFAQGIDVDDDSIGNVFVNEWFSGRKKAALDDFVVGTVDGFLLTALKQKHLALRHLGFSKKVVIIDEVHAYDTYMLQYLEEAIRWMGAYGTPVILVSATLTQDKRRSFLTAYLRGIGLKKREMIFPDSIDGIEYPLISYTDGKGIRAETVKADGEEKIVYVKRLDEKHLFQKIEESRGKGGVIGIIVNTVRRAQEIGRKCKELFGQNNVDILHSAYIATDRVKKESMLVRQIGNHAERPKRKIVIGTQVIEQSLDIDFDLLITDLCPMDLLLQRIGRLHRHDIKRPEIYKYPFVYVMGTSDEFAFERGSEKVYGTYYLIRTQYYLPDEIRIPSDIPVLVNKVYGDEVLSFQGELARVYHESFEAIKVLQKNKEDRARKYRIKDPCKKVDANRYNLMGWLKNISMADSDESAAAQVRDINETIEVIAVQRVGNGYGIFGEQKDISGLISDPNVSRELARQTIRLPHFVTQRKGISQTIEYLETYRLKYLKSWQEQPWLKGALGIIFDEEGHFNLDGVNIFYDQAYGLMERDEDGKI